MRKHEENINRTPLSELTFKSPTCLKRKKSSDDADKEEPGPSKESKGIASSLYESRKQPTACGPNLAVLSNLIGGKIDIPGPKLINVNPECYRKTTFGDAPSGSMLSYQCPLMPPNFKVYCSIEREPVDYELNFHYAAFPFTEIKNNILSYENEIYVPEIKKITLLEELKISARDSVSIEEDTRDQASDPKWFEYRKNRFTASLCNRLTGKSAPKTPRGLTTLAKNIVNPKELNKVIKLKMEYGKFYEPIAIRHYETFMKLSGFKISVEASGLVLDDTNYVLGATPDGKVICDGEMGILEVKCTDQYKDIDPKAICVISSNPMVVKDENGIFRISKEHSYYNQVQMQLALTCQTWCDFVLYTSQGLIIDRVKFDPLYWEVLQKKILDFYFTYMLPEIVNSDIVDG